MADELRALYTRDYIKHVATCLSDLAGTDVDAFVSHTLAAPWKDLALKARMARLTEGLVRFLPGPYEHDIQILQKLLPRICVDRFKYADLLSMFVPDFVVCNGMNNFDTSMEALKFFTSNGTSSEFAIRPFILRNPVAAMDYMVSWAFDDHSDVRRFSSEGCRPRLPWAMALPDFKKDPTAVLPILHTLRADPSKFVQKSVANNLNDIAKDNPDTVLDFSEKWFGSDKNTDWIIKHGCRTLLKQGNTRALALFGSSPVEVSNPKLALTKDQVDFGHSVEFTFEGFIEGDLPQSLRVEYAIDFMKANGKTSRKVFKISETKPTAQKLSFKKSHKFVNYTTRKHYAGQHQVSIILNGIEILQHPFTLKL